MNRGCVWECVGERETWKLRVTEYLWEWDWVCCVLDIETRWDIETREREQKGYCVQSMYMGVWDRDRKIDRDRTIEWERENNTNPRSSFSNLSSAVWQNKFFRVVVFVTLSIRRYRRWRRWQLLACHDDDNDAGASTSAKLRIKGENV